MMKYYAYIEKMHAYYKTQQTTKNYHADYFKIIYPDSMAEF